MHDYNKIGKVLEQIHMGVTIADANAVFVYAGKSYLDFTGIEHGWLEGRSAFDSAVLERFSPCITALVYEKQKKITTVQRMRSGAELFVTGIPIFDKSNKLEMIICYSSWDVTSYNDLYGTYVKTISAENNVCDDLNKLKKIKPINAKESVICASDKTKNAKRILDIFSSASRPAYVFGPEGAGKHFLTVSAYSGSNALYEYDCKFCDKSQMRSSLFDNNGNFIKYCQTLIIRNSDCLSHELQQNLIRAAFSGAVTLIAISTYSLEELKSKGKIVDEFYNYFRPYTVEIAPISERREDLKRYIEYYLNLYNHIYSRNISLSARAKNMLLCCTWQDNINELRAFTERLVLTAQSERIDVYNLPGDISPNAAENYTHDLTLKDMMELYEKDIITSIYNNCRTSVSLAHRLGISQATAIRKIHKYINEGK